MKKSLLTHLTQKKLFEFSLIKKTILDIHNELIKMRVWGHCHQGLPAHHAVSPALLIILYSTFFIVCKQTVNSSIDLKSLSKGIDVSHYLGNINWKKVKQSGIEFAFIKATEGYDFLIRDLNITGANLKNTELKEGLIIFLEFVNLEKNRLKILLNMFQRTNILFLQS